MKQNKQRQTPYILLLIIFDRKLLIRKQVLETFVKDSNNSFTWWPTWFDSLLNAALLCDCFITYAIHQNVYQYKLEKNLQVTELQDWFQKSFFGIF